MHVAEFSAGRVQKLNPAGRHLATFGLGAATASNITDVMIGDNGFIYAADSKRSVVHVFGESTRYLGFVGLPDGSRRDSTGALLRPYGLAIQGDRLTVIDRVRGQLNFKIIPEWFTKEPSS